MNTKDESIVVSTEHHENALDPETAIQANGHFDEEYQRVSGLLSGWHLAKEAANRANRNLIQYGGAAAAILGIQGASSGLFAISTSLMKNVSQLGLPWEAKVILWGLIISNTILFMLFAVISVNAFLARQKQEQEADDYLGKLIALGFMPTEQGVDRILIKNT